MTSRQRCLLAGFSAALLLCSRTAATWAQSFRPPAVPLVVSDPYLSIWSEADHLTDDVTRHWTRAPHSLTSLVRIDGNAFRVMGTEPASVPAMQQTSVRVFPTRSVYTFQGSGIELTLSFMTPMLPDDLNTLTRPVTYITWTARATDSKPHNVSVYFDAAPDIAVNKTNEPVMETSVHEQGLTALKVGTVAQPYLATPGDGVRIDWGYFYTAVPDSESPQSALLPGDSAREDFVSAGKLQVSADQSAPKAPDAGASSLAFVIPMGTVDSAPKSRWVMVAYDEVYSVSYFWTYLRPYWRRNGASAMDMLATSAAAYDSLTAKCATFDHELMADMEKEGGEKYAEIGALAYRQTIAGTGIAADSAGKPLLFTKENTSNGDIATVDVIFPMNPMLLLVSPTLAKASLVSNLDYASSSHWHFPNAPHDLGTYPLAWGRDDGGEAMPVEESGNILILCDAIAQADGNPSFASRWWPKLTQWAEFLQQFGLDPGNQLCTDDFMGPSPHNANLSVKAIIALAAYGDLCRMRGESAEAAKYAALSKTDAEHWVRACDIGDHSQLQFDEPGTWSQKYNMIWDKILGLNVFPPDVAAKEVAYYKSTLQQYGAPLDSRTKIAETPWTYWAAAMASNENDFAAITNPLVEYMNTTTDRDPLSDSYDSTNPGSGGMHARPVVGGIFARMLTDRAMWKKWASRDTFQANGWAPFPDLHPVPVVAAGDTSPQIWRVSTNDPGSGWQKPNYSDSKWKIEKGAFGNDITFPALVQTMWDTPDIYMRREVDIPAGDLSRVQLWSLLYGQSEVYINGILAVQPQQSSGIRYWPQPLSAKVLEVLKPGKNIIAVHCRNTGGDAQFADVGLVTLAKGAAQQ